ncbi:hypothetical protein [Lysobacter sp. HA18]
MAVDMHRRGLRTDPFHAGIAPSHALHAFSPAADATNFVTRNNVRNRFGPRTLSASASLFDDGHNFEKSGLVTRPVFICSTLAHAPRRQDAADP